jgi:hypothetical protein
MQTQLLIGGRLVAGEGAVESVLDAASGRITRWCGTSW